MSTKHYCDKCKKELSEHGDSIKINDGYMTLGSDTSRYSATYDICKPCLAGVVKLLESK